MGITKEYLTKKKELLNKISIVSGDELTDAIIEYLFEDNYYNVTLNIKEMLRFNSLSHILSDDVVKFYQQILTFDELSDEDKKELFNKYKDFNLNTKFYIDIRAMRNVAIDNIDSSLYKLNDENKTKEYEDFYPNTPIYDLRDKQFYLLVRCSPYIDSITDYVKNNYSLINQDNTMVYDTEGYIFGYKSIDKDYVLHMFEEDSMSHKLGKDEHDSGSEYVNRIMTPFELVLNSIDHSEIAIMNKKLDDGSYETKKPDFIVCFDEVDRKSVYEADKLHIPVVLINYKVPEIDIEEDKSNLKYR